MFKMKDSSRYSLYTVVIGYLIYQNVKSIMEFKFPLEPLQWAVVALTVLYIPLTVLMAIRWFKASKKEKAEAEEQRKEDERIALEEAKNNGEDPNSKYFS